VISSSPATILRGIPRRSFCAPDPPRTEPIQQVAADLNMIKKGVALAEKELQQLPPDSTDRLKTVLSVSGSTLTNVISVCS
jgi:hypothetical protein